MDNLPPEVIAHIFYFLTAKDLVSTALACKKFYACFSVESVWESKCYDYLDSSARTTLKSHLMACDNETKLFYNIYSQVLHPYGFLLEHLWRIEIGHYDAILQAKFVGSKIIGSQYLAPKTNDISQPLRKTELFTIEAESETGEAVLMCCQTKCTFPTLCKIKKETNSSNVLMTCQPNVFPHHPEGIPDVIDGWVRDEYGHLPAEQFEQLQFLHRLKAIHMLGHRNVSRFSPLKTPTFAPDGAVIRPGLFKGCYGSHGIELIQLFYDENNHALGKKITGDPNVPAGEISFQADLRRPMLLTAEQQETIDMLMAIDTPDVNPEVALNQLPEQSFRVPTGCFMFTHFNLPHTCKARFHGQGQIAGHNFSSPKFIRSHWIVFNEDLFGFIFLKLRSLNVYARIKNEFE